MTLSLFPVVSSQGPQAGSSADGEPDVRAGRNDDDTDQKKFSGKELSTGRNKNFVPLAQASTEKKAGKKAKNEPEQEEDKKDGSCSKKKDVKAAKDDGCGCDHTKKKKKDGAGLTAGAMKKLDKKGKGDPCWAGFEQAGMKKKGGKMVPNCIPTQAKKKDTYKKDAMTQQPKASTWASGFSFDEATLCMESTKLAAADKSRGKKRTKAPSSAKKNQIMANTRNT